MSTEISFAMVVRMQLETHRRLLSHSLDFVKQHVQSVERDLRGAARELEESGADVSEEYGEALSDEVWKFSELFPNLHRRSYAVTLMSVMEHFMNRLCRYSEKAVRASSSVTDLRGGGIRRAEEYLCRTAGMKALDSEAWRRLRIASVVRNSLVHADGRPKERDAQELRAAISLQMGFDLSEKGELILSDSFLPHLLADVNTIADELVSRLERALAKD